MTARGLPPRGYRAAALLVAFPRMYGKVTGAPITIIAPVSQLAGLERRCWPVWRKDEMEAMVFMAIAATMLVVAFWTLGLIGRDLHTGAARRYKTFPSAPTDWLGGH